VASSLIAVLREEIREAATGDTEFFKRGIWVFVLRTKPWKGPTGFDGTAIFPLPMPPEQFNLDLPFSGQTSPTQESGRILEENGILTGRATLSGSTGWKLREDGGNSFSGSGGFFTGELGQINSYFEKFSGQMLFWRLANRCFEEYSLLKQDPETNADTSLELHVFKDQLAWQIRPVTFSLTRSAARERVTYRYNIQVEIVGQAGEVHYDPPSETSLLDDIRNVVSNVRDAIQSVAAAIDDVTATIAELAAIVSSVASIVDDVGRILGAAQDFVDGVTDFIALPKTFISSAVAAIDEAADLFGQVVGLPADVRATFRGIGDDLDAMVVSARNHFTEEWATAARKYNADTDPYNNTRGDSSSARVAQQVMANLAAEAADSQGRMSVDKAFGGTYRPGDAKRAAIARRSNWLSTDYSGYEERTINEGDTLQSLAAKYLGDARRWKDIAIVNGLSSPYITARAKLPNTLQSGQPIAIPVRKRAVPPQVSSLAITPLGQSRAEAALGTEFELVEHADGQLSWEVDLQGGSVDARKVAGLKCYAQGINLRMRTEQGTHILFPSVGLPRFVGVNNSTVIAQSRLGIRQQVLADPRTERLVSMALSVDGDALTIENSVRPVGFSTAKVISTTLR
jgi:LysM domain